jgi:DNA polymerase-3 subunit delta
VVYLFTNADEYLAAQRLAALKAALGDPELAGLNIAELGPSGVDPVRLLAEASLMPFLAEKRLLIVRGYLDGLDKRMAAAKNPGSAVFLEAAELLTRLPLAPETCDIAFVDAAVDKRRGLYKGFTLPAAGSQPERKVPGLEVLVKSGAVQMVDLPTPDAKTLPAWLQQHVRERKIAIKPDALALLANFVGRNLRQLDNELEKLALYALGREVTVGDVRAMVADASEEMIWNLTDGLCQRNPNKAMHALRELRRSDQHPLAMLSSIARQYRLLIQVKTVMQRGVLAADKIAAELGEKSFPVEKAQKLVGLYSFGELDAIMDRLLETDMAMKTGGDEDTLLDVLVADLTRERRDPSKRTQPAHASGAPLINPFS